MPSCRPTASDRCTATPRCASICQLPSTLMLRADDDRRSPELSARLLRRGQGQVERISVLVRGVYRTASRNAAASSRGARKLRPDTLDSAPRQHYDEIIVPTPPAIPMREGERLIQIAELDAIARGSFPVSKYRVLALVTARVQGYKSLNRLQSVVYPTAYQTNENMLVCAPTGAVRQWCGQRCRPDRFAGQDGCGHADGPSRDRSTRAELGRLEQADCRSADVQDRLRCADEGAGGRDRAQDGQAPRLDGHRRPRADGCGGGVRRGQTDLDQATCNCPAPRSPRRT